MSKLTIFEQKIELIREILRNDVYLPESGLYQNLEDKLSSWSLSDLSDFEFILRHKNTPTPVVEESKSQYTTDTDGSKITVGMGATKVSGSDRYAYTITRIISAKKIAVTRDTARRTDKNGLSELQEYEYTSNFDGPETILRLRKNGRWVPEGESLKGTGFGIGYRREYSDPSF